MSITWKDNTYCFLMFQTIETLERWLCRFSDFVDLQNTYHFFFSGVFVLKSLMKKFSRDHK